jgi:Carboxypeptidase regulatory-like domain/TonB dependent receptor
MNAAGFTRSFAIFLIFVGVVAVLLANSVPTYAQVAGGTILGTVSDSSGAVIADAQITIKDVATGVVRAVTSNSAGFYSAPNLAPARYDLRISATGFSAKTASGVTLTVGAEQTVNVVLKVGDANATVEVSDIASGVDTATSSLSGEVDGTTVRELPLNGRDWSQLATLQPGVNQVRNQSSIGGVGSADVVRGARGFGNQLSVSGTRPTQNNYRLDGISFNDYTNGAPGGVLGSLSGVDAIQEFSVLTTNYSAEYGRTSGGVINAITRTGTNQFHGDVYEFLRNSALDARNFFDGTNVPPFKRNQFGGSVGGPIVKERTFFFFNYEGMRQSLSSTQVNTVPSANARNGILSTGNVTVDSAIVPYLQFWPLPNSGLNAGGDTGQASVVTKQPGTDNFYTARIDHHFSARDSLAGSFFYDKTQLSNPDPMNNETFFNSNSRSFVSLEETHIFSPLVVNSARFGFSRNSADILTAPGNNPLASDTSLGTITGQAAPFLIVPGISNFLGGVDGFPNFTFGWNSFQGYDDAFVTRGKHSIKFGFAVERMQSNNLFHFFDNGRFFFPSLSAFLTNQPLAFAATVPSSATPRGIRETLFGGYIQDDWKVRSNLTLNLGLRYEMITIPTEVNGKQASLKSMTDSSITVGAPYFNNNPTTKNFEPRVGFAWDPFRNGKTSVRGGFGIFDVLPLPYEFLIISSASAPVGQNLNFGGLQPGDFPTNAYNKAIATCSPSISLVCYRTSFIDPSPKRNYVMQWNLNVQREIAPQTSVTVAYVGSRGLHLPFRTDDADIVLPTQTPAGYLWPTTLGKQVNPNVGRIDRLSFDADSYYDALQLGLEKKMSHGLQIQGSFTWGKSLDTGSSTIAGDQFSNSPSSLPVYFDSRVRKGQSDFNLARNLVVSGTWEIPGFKSRSGFTGWATHGWQIGGVLQASSGAPFTVLIGGDPLGLGSTDPFAYPNRLTGAGCGSAVNPGNPKNYIKVQCFGLPQATPAIAARCVPYSTDPNSCSNLLGNSGRNGLTGPGLINVDFSVFKNMRITERANLQFRAEMFNIFNHTNFAPPLDNNTLFNQDGTSVGSAGVIDSTQTTSRQIQFGLKLAF